MKISEFKEFPEENEKEKMIAALNKINQSNFFL